MTTYRVLSFDGGGVRGIITVRLMMRLAAMPGLGGWHRRARFFAGTSTGGLIALGLARGLSLVRLFNLYKNKSAKIFDDSWLDNLFDVGQVIGAQYDNDQLEQELKKLVGEASLKNLCPDKLTRVLVTTFDLDQADDVSITNDELPGVKKNKPNKWKPKIFHNFPGNDTDGRLPAYKAGLYTSAAPTYFPIVDGYIDGGVFANNPSMCALAQTQDPRNADANDQPALRDVVLFSLGTGEALKYISGLDNDWGYAQWAKPILNILMDGVAGIADYQCRQILRERYHRLQPALTLDFALDSYKPEQIQAMIDFADAVPLDATAEWLREKWMKELSPA